MPTPGWHIRERLLEAWAIIACPTLPVGTQLLRLHACLEQRITLEVGRLPVVVIGGLP